MDKTKWIARLKKIIDDTPKDVCLLVGRETIYVMPSEVECEYCSAEEIALAVIKTNKIHRVR